MQKKIRMITSHVDKHNDKITLEGLEDFVRLTNQQYTPIGVEHDPRIPPIGRVLSAYIVPLEDGEYAADGIAEIFEKAEDIEFRDDGREIPIREFDEQLHISPDNSYQSPDDQQLLEEMRSLVDGDISYQIKKAVDPISLLIIAASFVAGGIATGFLGKIGEDAWDHFKKKLNELMSRKRKEDGDRLLEFDFTVRDEDQLLSLQTILTNPSENDITRFLQTGLKQLDERTPRFFKHTHYLRKVVLEYKDGQLHVVFGLRKDGVPLSIKLDE